VLSRERRKQVWTADRTAYCEQLEHARKTLKHLGKGARDTRLSVDERREIRDFIAAMGFVPNPRSNSGQPTAPIRVPVVGREEYDVTVPFASLWFMLPARMWPYAHAVHEDPQQLVVHGGGGGGGADGAPDEDDGAVLKRRRAEAQAAKRLARARGRAAQQAIEVCPCRCTWPAAHGSAAARRTCTKYWPACRTTCSGSMWT